MRENVRQFDLLKGIRFAHTIIKLLPPAPSHMGGGFALLRFVEPPDGGGKYAQSEAVPRREEIDKIGTVPYCHVKGIRCAHAIFRLPPLPPPTWEGVLCR